MASEAITKNDLKAILNEVLPPTPSEYKKLLWQNSNPTAAFAAQTISLDLSDYDEIEIIAKKTASEPYYFSTRIPMGVTSNTHYIENGVIFDRNVVVSLASIEFKVAYYLLPTSTAITTDNNRCMPYQIYGIKHERVAPPQVELPTYSTEEQVVGTWIDGKPIYRKVYIPFEAKSYASGSYTMTLDVPIDKIIRWDVLTTGNSGENQEVNKYIVPGRYTKISNQISLDCNISSYNTNITHVILEYTKTTD